MSKEHSRKPERDDEHQHHSVSPEGRSDPSADAPEDAATAAPREARTGDVSAEELARLVTEKEELKATLVRRQADFDNYRKRIERERKEESRRGISHLLHDLLPVLDGFERALEAHPAHDDYRKGVELIYRSLSDTLGRHGLQRISAEGKKFDPHYHEAIERVETHEHPDGTILQVVQEGYLFDGRVLRPSLVRVAVAHESAGGDASSAEHSRAN
jgi:molecular chaperone GrpE